MALEPLAPVTAPNATKWTCPMHPEIVRDEPGSCPKCGMALEPMESTGEDEGENEELRDMTRRLWPLRRLLLQRRGPADRRRRPVPVLRDPAEPDHRGRRDELQRVSVIGNAPRLRLARI
jgi:hypothetical protein